MDTNLTYTHTYLEDEDSIYYDRFILAKNLFDLREFKKCAYTLKFYRTDLKNQEPMFLYHYALFLHGDMKKEENKYLIDHSSGNFNFKTRCSYYERPNN